MITVELRDTTELFDPPQTDPFEGRFTSDCGADQILEAARRARAVPLTIEVRVSGRPTHSEANVQRALAKYWEVRIEELRVRRRRVWSRGFKELAVGVLFLAVCLAVSASLSNVEWRTEWLGRFAIEGVIIVGWIALWHPVDMLLFEPWPLNSELRALARLTDATIQLDAPR